MHKCVTKNSYEQFSGSTYLTSLHWSIWSRKDHIAFTCFSQKVKNWGSSKKTATFAPSTMCNTRNQWKNIPISAHQSPLKFSGLQQGHKYHKFWSGWWLGNASSSSSCHCTVGKGWQGITAPWAAQTHPRYQDRRLCRMEMCLVTKFLRFSPRSPKP